MKVFWRFSCFAHEQPSPQVWDRVLAITAGTGLETGVPVMRLGTVASEAERDELAGRLREAGAVFTVGPETVYDDADRAAADYLAVFPAEARLDVLNPAVLVPTGPCPGCGLADEFDADQTGPFAIASDAVPGDTSALPGGGMAVSARLVAVLRDLGARGWATAPLLVAGRPSPRWSQLVADRAVLLPCEHTEVTGDGFCEHCGRALGQVTGSVLVLPGDTAGDDVIARHPSRRAMLHLSRRMREALGEAGVDDVTSTDVLQVCPQHQ